METCCRAEPSGRANPPFGVSGRRLENHRRDVDRSAAAIARGIAAELAWTGLPCHRTKGESLAEKV